MIYCKTFHLYNSNLPEKTILVESKLEAYLQKHEINLLLHEVLESNFRPYDVYAVCLTSFSQFVWL